MKRRAGRAGSGQARVLSLLCGRVRRRRGDLPLAVRPARPAGHRRRRGGRRAAARGCADRRPDCVVHVLHPARVTAAGCARAARGIALRDAAIAILAVVGVALLLPRLGELAGRPFARLAALGGPLTRQREGIGGGLVLGVGLGLVWTPCAGPILAAVTALAAERKLSLDAALVTFVYALGAGLPLLAVALAGTARSQGCGPRGCTPRPCAGRAASCCSAPPRSSRRRSPPISPRPRPS